MTVNDSRRVGVPVAAATVNTNPTTPATAVAATVNPDDPNSPGVVGEHRRRHLSECLWVMAHELDWDDPDQFHCTCDDDSPEWTL